MFWAGVGGGRVPGGGISDFFLTKTVCVCVWGGGGGYFFFFFFFYKLAKNPEPICKRKKSFFICVEGG